MDGKLSSLPDARGVRLEDGERYQYKDQELIAARIAQDSPDNCHGCELDKKPGCYGISCREFILLTPLNYITRRLLE